MIKEEQEKVNSFLAITDDSIHGLKVALIEKKGRGIVAVKNFNKGDFVVEYAGDLIDVGTARSLETSMDISKGCYMFYFEHQGNKFCIDATSESGRIGHLVNHSCISPNCSPKVVNDAKEVPHLLYDYKD